MFTPVIFYDPLSSSVSIICTSCSVFLKARVSCKALHLLLVSTRLWWLACYCLALPSHWFYLCTRLPPLPASDCHSILCQFFKQSPFAFCTWLACSLHIFSKLTHVSLFAPEETTCFNITKTIETSKILASWINHIESWMYFLLIKCYILSYLWLCKTFIPTSMSVSQLSALFISLIVKSHAHVLLLNKPNYNPMLSWRNLDVSATFHWKNKILQMVWMNKQKALSFLMLLHCVLMSLGTESLRYLLKNRLCPTNSFTWSISVTLVIGRMRYLNDYFLLPFWTKPPLLTTPEHLCICTSATATWKVRFDCVLGTMLCEVERFPRSYSYECLLLSFHLYS